MENEQVQSNCLAELRVQVGDCPKTTWKGAVGPQAGSRIDYPVLPNLEHLVSQSYLLVFKIDLLNFRFLKLLNCLLTSTPPILRHVPAIHALRDRCVAFLLCPGQRLSIKIAREYCTWALIRLCLLSLLLY